VRFFGTLFLFIVTVIGDIKFVYDFRRETVASSSVLSIGLEFLPLQGEKLFDLFSN
jgi:hypothetical protein